MGTVVMFVVLSIGVLMVASIVVSRTWRSRRKVPMIGSIDPWKALRQTGNGIGHAPTSLRTVASMDDDAFEELYNGELVDKFWHQGTIYAATPYAVRELLDVLGSLPVERQVVLVGWMRMCLDAELRGAALASHAGVWLPARDIRRLAAARIAAIGVDEVLRAGQSTLQAVADASPDDSLHAALAALRSHLDP